MLYPAPPEQWADALLSYEISARTSRRTRILMELAEIRCFAAFFKQHKPCGEWVAWQLLHNYCRYLALWELWQQEGEPGNIRPLRTLSRSLFDLMSAGGYCALPQYHDAGAPVDPRGKLYLVCGATVEFPEGRPTAHALYTRSSGSSIKGYSFVERALMLAAWRATCERGEHGHPAPTGPAMALSPPRTPAAEPHEAVPAPVFIESRSPSPTIVASPAARPLQPARLQACVAPSGSRTYAVRLRGVGHVFDNYDETHDHFHGLQQLGEHPVLFSGHSLTAAICFLERGPSGAAPEDLDQRRVWIAEERAARRLIVDCDDGSEMAGPSTPDEEGESDGLTSQ
ncbi:hypothetical protein FB451DRAFT_1415492 [Mycena latifolia]|nr:hypothetical protein FB451DRAFT_1415492 [Mycena latifolia]